ncbi:MAG: class I SAM-dependent methyltransferase [Myxococcota bacterium]|nr:class I SAM-dependent methyltransferase [Myxococcota bacterium]
MMERVPEPELMLDSDQVRAYAEGDFELPHAHCVELLLGRLGGLPASGVCVDLGCGPAEITLRLAERLAGWQLYGVDGSAAMLARGREGARVAALEQRVHLYERLLPARELPGAPFDLVFSNSLLHHLADPAGLWTTARAVARPGASLFVMDLLRPGSRERVRELVELYAAGEPEVLRRDFEASLCAAYTPDEVREQLEVRDLGGLRVEVVSDRHWIAWGALPLA